MSADGSALDRVASALVRGFPAFAYACVVYLHLPIGGPIALAGAIVCAFVMFQAVERYRARAVSLLTRFGPHPGPASISVWLCAVVLGGALLRLWFWAGLEITQFSDHAAYLALAHKIVAGDIYELNGEYAFWPPGLPTALSAWIWLGASDRGAIALNQFTWLSVAVVATYALGRELYGRKTGAIAALFIAIWPNYVFNAGYSLKECILIGLCPMIAWLCVRALQADSTRTKGALYLATGVLAGVATLTQPSTLALAGGVVAYLLLKERTLRGRVLVSLIAAGMLATVGPWVLRNHAVLGVYALGTGGGQNLYMANHPASFGGWGPVAARAAMELSDDEVTRNSLATRLAIEQIRSDPAEFGKKVLWRATQIYGRDSLSARNLIVLDHALDQRWYLPLTVFNNAFWVVMLALVQLGAGGGSVAGGMPAARLGRHAALLMLILYYPNVFHLVFEGSERHRYAIMAVVAILAARAFVPAGMSQGRDRPGSRANPASVNAPS